MYVYFLITLYYIMSRFWNTYSLISKIINFPHLKEQTFRKTILINGIQKKHGIYRDARHKKTVWNYGAEVGYILKN